MHTENTLITGLAASDCFRKFEQAYGHVTAMPLSLLPLETFDFACQNKEWSNRFCSLMATKSALCAECLRFQDSLRRLAMKGVATAVCPQGLWEAAVPVWLGSDVIGFLQTGQVMVKKPAPATINLLAKAHAAEVAEIGDRLEASYLKTPVLSEIKFQSALHILENFAELLSIKSNRIMASRTTREHPAVTKARQIIQQRADEDITLRQVARLVHVSPYYLCKLFPRCTGMAFNEYVSRIRTEKAKQLLTDPRRRVSEIVYDAGFQSLTHFNRMFKHFVGESPTKYREHLRSPLGSFLPRRINRRHDKSLCLGREE